MYPYVSGELKPLERYTNVSSGYIVFHVVAAKADAKNKEGSEKVSF